MDHRRFDAALRALQTGTTRRSGLAAAIGALLGGAGLASAATPSRHAGPRATEDGGKRGHNRRNRPGAEGPCGNGSRKDNTCTKDSQCCTGICRTGLENKDGSGRCRCVKKGKPCTADRNCCNGMTCRDGACARGDGPTPPPPPACSSATCPTGCCDGDTCVPGTTAAACGTAGAACVACSSSTPICSAGTCAAGTWSYSAQFGTFGSGDENFFGPNRIYVSADGQTAWIADTGNNRIVVWTRPDATSKTWSYHAQFGTQGSGDSYLSAPTGVVDSPDTLSVWIADTENNRIAIWTRPDATSKTWTYSTQFGTQGFGDSDVSYPNGVFISADTLTAWVADTVNNRIVIWTRPDAASKTWSYSTQFGSYGTGDTNFDTPRAVVVSPDTLTAWVTDQGNFRVVIWTRPTAASTTWTYSTQFGSQGSGDDNFGTLAGIFVAADTLTAWIADLNQNRIVIWTRPDATSKTWSYSAQFGTAGSGDDNLGGPAGVFASPDSLTAWVVDGGNDRVVIWTQS